LCRLRRADRSALAFDLHPFDEPLDGFLDDLDAYPDRAVRGGAALLVRGTSTPLRAPNWRTSRLGWPRGSGQRTTASWTSFFLHKSSW